MLRRNDPHVPPVPNENEASVMARPDHIGGIERNVRRHQITKLLFDRIRKGRRQTPPIGVSDCPIRNATTGNDIEPEVR